MAFISARYAPTDELEQVLVIKPGERPVIATDDQGVEWRLAENSKVGDWLRFIQTNPTIAEYVPEEPEDD